MAAAMRAYMVMTNLGLLVGMLLARQGLVERKTGLLVGKADLEYTSMFLKLCRPT